LVINTSVNKAGGWKLAFPVVFFFSESTTGLLNVDKELVIAVPISLAEGPRETSIRKLISCSPQKC
jgi:hypothetical protein